MLVTFESDWRKAKEILTEIATTARPRTSARPAEERLREAARKFMIFYTQLTPDGVHHGRGLRRAADHPLPLRPAAAPRRRARRIWEDILDAFAAADDIDFAYPTQRFYTTPSRASPAPGPSLLPRERA